jgi:Concanavalin A-like lectin/glucanases superfamily
VSHHTAVTRSTRRRVGRLAPLAICMLFLALLAGGCVKGPPPHDDADTTNTPPASNSPPPSNTPPPNNTPPPDETPPPVDNNPPSDPPPVSDVAAFEQTLYPMLRASTNFCAGCHGASQIPTFADADVMTAYNVIMSQQKVNLDAPLLSRVYLRPALDRHNCGGAASCDRIAADLLAGIEAWAAQTPGAPPSTGVLMSAATTFAAGMAAGSARAEDAEIALFTFSEGAGDVAMDTSGVGTPIALQISGMEWVEGGLRNVSGKAQASLEDSRKLYDMITPAGAYSIEAWLVPENTTQDGPARIVSYSSSTSTRNFMLGQAAIYYRFRNRTALSNANGDPALEALDPQVATAQQHVVMTFDPAVGRKIYINGALSIEEDVPDTLAWTDDQIFVIGNEVTDDRLWQGVLQMVAIHNKALSAAEVQQNYSAGTGNLLTLNFDISNILGNAGHIEMLAAELDAASYLFARPVFVSAATGIRVKNIRVAVNDSVPVAAQTFRRIDTTVMASGTELSRLGAVIPQSLGAQNDRFHLEFEVLGGRMGEAESIAPSSPPLPPEDVPEPELGIRSFSKINDTMSALTGIDSGDAAVSTLYAEIRDSLPASDALLAFVPAQQIAIQRLATAYCGALVSDGATCSNFFGACSIDANAKNAVAGTLYDKLMGTGIANQPDRTSTSAELVGVFDDLGCTNGCTGATAQTALNAACAAVLASGAVTIN